MSRSPAWAKARLRLVGVVFLLVFALLIWFSLALYHKQFTPVAMVTLYTDSVGNEMHLGADVMVRGVQVGEVRSISADGTGSPARAGHPAGHGGAPARQRDRPDGADHAVRRAVRGPADPGPAPPLARLTAGSVIRQDHSADAVEVEKVLNNLLPLLQASEPDKLSVTLTAIAQGLQGRGKELGQTLVQLDSLLRRYNPHLPALDNDIKQLAGVARTLNQASPDLLQALDDFTVTSQTLTSERASFSALYSTVTTASNDIRAFLDANSNNIISLSTDSTATLQILARYSPEFPCVLKDLRNFVPAADKLLGKGTNQPGLHVQAIIVPVYNNARYLPGVDTPKYGYNLGPHCYSVPFKGITLNDGTSPLPPLPAASSGSGASKGQAGAGSGGSRASAGGSGVTTRAAIAGTPSESELVRELAGLALDKPPSTVPAWSSLLLAPLFRGTAVSLVSRS